MVLVVKDPKKRNEHRKKMDELKRKFRKDDKPMQNVRRKQLGRKIINKRINRPQSK
jgi:hypothetical protein